MRPTSDPTFCHLSRPAQPRVPTSSVVPWALPNLPNLSRVHAWGLQRIYITNNNSNRLGRLVRLGQSLCRKGFERPDLGAVVGQVGQPSCFTGIHGAAAGEGGSFRFLRFGVGSSPEGSATGNSDLAFSLVTGVFPGGYGD